MQNLSKLKKLVECIRSAEEEFPVRYCAILIELKGLPDREHVTVSQLATRTNIPLGTISRALKYLGKYKEKGKDGNPIDKGLDYITMKNDIYDGRVMYPVLTKKGEVFLGKLDMILYGEEVSCG